MYDLPKKEDALLYQSKGKTAVGWALTPSIPLPRGPQCQEEPEASIPTAPHQPWRGAAVSQAPNRIQIRTMGPGGGHHSPLYSRSLPPFPRL